MVQRERLQERYRKREVLMRERMGVGRERMRARQVGGKYATPEYYYRKSVFWGA